MGLAGLTGFGGFRMFGGGGLCPSIFIIGGIPLMACIATSSGSYGALSGKRVGAGKRARLFLIHCDTTNSRVTVLFIGCCSKHSAVCRLK